MTGTGTEDWQVVAKKKKKTGGRKAGTRNVSVSEKKEKSKGKKPVGRPNALIEAADPEVIHPGGVKQRKLNFGPSIKVTTKSGQDIAVVESLKESLGVRNWKTQSTPLKRYNCMLNLMKGFVGCRFR